jgi:putative endonuclease
MKSYLYILKSLKNSSYYVGISHDVEKRIKQHNSGCVKATKYKRPYIIVFKQEYDNMVSAHRAELKIKSWKRRDFIDKIVEDKQFNFLGR